MAAVNFGDTTAPSAGSYHSENYIYCSKITANGTYTVDSVNIWISATGKPTTGSMKCALYTATGLYGLAGTLLTNGTTEEKAYSTITGGQWTTFLFGTPPSITATSYWIAVWSDNSWNSAKGAGGSNNWGYFAKAYGAWPATADELSSGSFSDVDIYIACSSAAWTPRIIII